MFKPFDKTMFGAASLLALVMAPPLAAQDAAPADTPAAETPADVAPDVTPDAAPAEAAPALPAPTAPTTLPASRATLPAAGTYRFDPAHSQAMFSYDHMGFSTSRGFVNGIEGTITLDPADPAKSSVEASFPLSALRTVDAELDKQLMGPDFFNVAGEAPRVTFTSTSVEADGDDHDEMRVTGDLTLNGITRPVVLEVEFNGAGQDPVTQAPTVGFSIETELRRSDFNLGAFAPFVEDEVEIDIDVEARKNG